LEDDDSMTSIIANAFKIPIKNKKDIYEKFLKLCRVPATYVEYLWSQGIYFIPIFYRHDRDKDYLAQLDYIDGIIMIGGTVYNSFPSNYKKQKKIDNDYNMLNLTYTDETTINKYPQVVTEIMERAVHINDVEKRTFVVMTTCESFMEFIIKYDHRINMYVVNNNSKQLPLYFTRNDPEIIEHSQLYNLFTEEERQIIEEKEVGFFFHNFGFHSPELYFYEEIAKMFWPVLSFKQVKNGKTYYFLAGVEAKNYPFIGFQNHFEKILYERYMNVKLQEWGSGVGQKIMGLVARWARDKKNDKSKKKDIKDLPDKYKCLSILGQEILLFQYVYMYDCKGIIAKNYKEAHHLDEQIKKVIEVKDD
jgi:hypothetical protein